MNASQRGANQINPSLGLKPLICNLISGGCLGHEDTQQGQGLLYREIRAFGHSLGFDQQSHQGNRMSVCFSVCVFVWLGGICAVLILVRVDAR